MIFIAIILILGLCFSIYMSYRNDYVYNYRGKILHDFRWSNETRMRIYEKLPSYDKMLWQIFTWDWSKYLDE